jgi:hypothetical protein
MIRSRLTIYVVLLALLLSASLHLQARQLPGLPITLSPVTFAPGDLIVSLETGPVLWLTVDGILRRVLAQTSPGTGEGMALDAARNLYVTRWCIDPFCGAAADGGSVEKYNNLGLPLGKVAATFDCSPHTILFDAAGATYVGQAGCNKSILKFAPGQAVPTEHAVQQDNQGVFWMDLAGDGCTMFYTSFGPNVKRYNVCTMSQLPDFNAASMPGGMAQDLRVLPDGGVLVSSGQVVARLNSAGVLTQTYEVPGEATLWSGLDFADNGTAFWVGNYFTSNLYKFNLATGATLASISIGTPSNSVVGIRVVR